MENSRVRLIALYVVLRAGQVVAFFYSTSALGRLLGGAPSDYLFATLANATMYGWFHVFVLNERAR